MQFQLSERYGGLDQWGAAIMDPHYSAARAWAGNTPFQWGKQVGSHLGGTRDPMVVHWPARIKDAGGLRSQFTHVIDLAPTILELAGIPAPIRSTGTRRSRYTDRCSRALERRCQDDIAFRFLTAQAAPDFVVINRFRARHGRR